MLREAPDKDGHCQVWPAHVSRCRVRLALGKRVYVFEWSGTIAEQIIKLDGMIAKLLQMANSVRSLSAPRWTSNLQTNPSILIDYALSLSLVTCPNRSTC